ncbi:copper amine oxidase N-terminal domain-containing protein [Paenibacillus glycinis]|uniref:Copper amine oxidase-like N-terminal domain-containing protein n=1 Tax=Paenibacillus glycinis TaxID=2697035 RepID=A0ABW9XLA3_9BACL|nr:copper amine oxidase N-terminal domain-containing protein [Paenibacillus glycinis]NBD23219.1 hypothetical protein [Paenibacillus glycinis]
MKPTIKSLLMLSAVLAGSLSAVQANAAAGAPNAGGSVVFQQGNPLITVGGEQVKVQLAPYSQNGTFMVPVRELAEGLNASAAWKDGGLTLTQGNRVILVKGSRLQTNGKSVALPAAIQNKNGKVYVPLRAVGGALGGVVDFRDNSAVVTASAPVADKPVAIRFDFAKDAQGWTGGFADLPVEHAGADYQLDYKWSPLPVIDHKQLNGLMVKGMNRSDDLFMFVARKLDAKDGLKPGTTYDVKLDFRLATNEASDSIGVGGSPGQSVYVKAGVTNTEPKSVEVLDSGMDSSYHMNLDKGNQATDGKDMKLVGDASKPDGSKEGYQLKPMQLSAVVTTGANGEAYLVIGTDSGYEGLSTFYFTDIHAVFTPQAKS